MVAVALGLADMPRLTRQDHFTAFSTSDAASCVLTSDRSPSPTCPSSASLTVSWSGPDVAKAGMLEGAFSLAIQVRVPPSSQHGAALMGDGTSSYVRYYLNSSHLHGRFAETRFLSCNSRSNRRDRDRPSIRKRGRHAIANVELPGLDRMSVKTGATSLQPLNVPLGCSLASDALLRGVGAMSAGYGEDD